MENSDIVFNKHVQGLLAVGEARCQQSAKQALQPGILEIGSASSGGDFFHTPSALKFQDKEIFTHQAYHSLQGEYKIHSLIPVHRGSRRLHQQQHQSCKSSPWRSKSPAFCSSHPQPSPRRYRSTHSHQLWDLYATSTGPGQHRRYPTVSMSRKPIFAVPRCTEAPYLWGG